MFNANIYVERRKKLKEKVNSGILLFLGNEESSMNYADNTFHFRQDSTFLYFFGLDHAGLAAIIDLDSGEETIFGNDLTIDDIVWMGTHPTIKDRCEKVGIDKSYPLAKLQESLNTAKSQNRKIHILPPYRPENKIKLFNLLGINPNETSDAASVEFIKAVVDLRSVKSKEEIVEINKAVSISNEMHLLAMKCARPGMYESEIAAAITEVALSHNGQLAFPAIVTVHGETLHNHYHGNKLKSGDMLLVDAGAETTMHYAGDLSHTIPVDPTFTQRQKEIYQIVSNAHEAAISSLKPDFAFKDVHLTACKTITSGLKEMGFMKGDIDEAVNQGAHALFFQCGTGHMMGLDVHDMEDLGEVWVGYNGEPKSTQFGLKSLRLARKLEPGFVVTIEPGIYFIPELIDMWKAENKFADFINYDKVSEYKDFGGLRSEEDFVITENGYELLGGPIPKTIEEIEEIRSN